MMLERSGNFRLSTREKQVLLLVLEGASSRQMGAALGIAQGTVGTYLARLYNVSGCHSRESLAQFARMQPQILEGERGERKAA
jgi:DNA-binding CsgD family transcriptional regulator